MILKTGLVYDPRYLIHDTGRGHPERKERLERTLEYLETLPWFTSLKRIQPRIAEQEWIESAHTSAYFLRAEKISKSGMLYLDTPDVGVCRDSFDIARLAVGGALELADHLIAREIQNGFALLRPPGHHAEQSQAMGFCIFNNVAILARYLKKQHGLDKILILDWDVHHGNGTQHTFEEDPSVLYVSLHQYPYYPGTGAASETGIGRGDGATLNCPMPAGAGNREYEQAFRERILPKINEFKPDIVLISAGFDAHRDDPLAQINLTTEFFGWMSERMMEVADKHAHGRLLSLLEGGYHLEALPRSIAAHLAATLVHP